MELVKELGLKSGGYEKITVSGTAIGFTTNKVRPTTGDFAGKVAQEAHCTLETKTIRYNCDGSTPTSALGHLVAVGGEFTIKTPNDLDNFKAIKVDDDATLHVTYRFL